MLVLGIESSCDETAAAVVEDGWRVRSNIVSSSLALHQPHGGVVPELACRAHVEVIGNVVERALREARCALEEIELVAVTAGPGLVGALFVGVSFAQGLAMAHRLPLLGVNHLAAHLYAGIMADCEQQDRLTQPYPALGLVVSGGHTLLVRIQSPLDYEMLGETQDDAAGEAFDKVAKLLGLGYPGGPIIDRLAKQGDARRMRWPRPRLEAPLDFSFSGLKTAVYYYVREHQEAVGQAQFTADMAASFQYAVVDALIEKVRAAVRATGITRVIVGGGVSANSLLRAQLAALAVEERVALLIPRVGLCIDNAAMIAGLGWAQWQAGHRTPVVEADPNYPWLATPQSQELAHAIQ